jgi:hypothetical protein
MRSEAVTLRKYLPVLNEDPDFDIDSVPGRMILSHMIERVRDHRIAAEDVSERAAEEIFHLERTLFEVMRLVENNQAKEALTIILNQLAVIDASLSRETSRAQPAGNDCH